MGVKQFNLDLKAAVEAAGSLHRVSNLRKGDSDGEIAFTYTPDAELSPIDIQALSTDADSYPRHPGFLIFTSAEITAGQDVENCLQEISGLTKGKSVTDAIVLISRALTAKLDSPDQSTLQETSVNGSESDDDSVLGIDQDSIYDSDDYMLDIDPLPPTRLAENDTTQSPHAGSTPLLKRHLREAKKEGFQISIPFAEKKDEAFGVFSLSIRVSRLGIPEEALEAWDVKPSEYVVMVFKLPVGYPSLSDFVNLPSDQTTMQFKFGKCGSPRPSYYSMRRIFEHENWKGSDEVNNDEENHTNAFVPLLMSASLDSLLNQEFSTLLRLRRSEKVSWDRAQAMRFKLSRRDHLLEGRDVLADDIVDEGEDNLADWFGLEFLRRDYVLAGEDDLNILLVAMQFGLQRLIKCTKYCMVCHQRIEGGFEAVKPYVCDNLLCLYQYLSLGFGQSIEHEIINSPYVVDLLISFFYSAVSSSRLREFPQGLGLKCACSGFAESPTKPITAEACFENNTIKFESTDYASYRSIRDGHYILLVVADPKVPLLMPIMKTYSEKHICVIESCSNMDFTFKIVATYAGPVNIEANQDNQRATQATHPTPGGVKALVLKYDQDVDELESAERDLALTVMTKCIPSVQEMKDYLTERPGRRLISWKRMDSSTLSLLNWIVASNRSLIVQDAPLPGSSPADGEMDKRNLVRGMNAGWMQFRFAQGSPEKEQVFLKELEQVTQFSGQGSQKTYQSLFAWHGSPLENWHSIIRTGLDFSQTLNGRAHGNGVYFAKEFATSCGYSGRRSGSSSYTWPNSALRATNAISICEIVNKPAQFVSTSPYFVVNKIEWIQCRYLFVQVQQSSREAMLSPEDETYETVECLEQDPSHKLTGCGKQPIGIPLSAIPASRRRTLGQGQTNVPGSAKECPIVLDEPEDDMSGEGKDSIDDLLASDDEDDHTQPMTTVRKRRRTSTDSGLGETRPFGLTQVTQGPQDSNTQEPNNITPFQPGQLDLSSLPKLVEPTWASSSPAALRALNGQVKDLQKIQSKTSLATLGWYIDFDKIDNMFHWIVELHSFDKDLPLAQDMTRHGCSSIVLELRFGASYPISPPFVRVIRPRFLPFAQGGGGHVTVGGAICSELLTNSGWSPALSLEKVFLEVRMNLCDMDPPARLEGSPRAGIERNMDYNMFEAVDAFRRAATAHGWQIPSDLEMMASMITQYK
ncbi:hypothetical protein NW762_001266 [Fusarium torreyae]|uniref:UBC core domain-containing protein n=1 Tax=Fusarium torreyae TaxID=1237075 RepID=A0A9W8VNT3_9HYPO|nr:hypothetical protein NW762_001266 [Fusarium torreyae]